MVKRSSDQEEALHLISKAVPTLAYFSRRAEEASFMEEILNNIFKTRFLELNEQGKRPRYAIKGEDAEVGNVGISGVNNHDEYCMDISFHPSPKFNERVRYLQRVIGVINLSDKTYGMGYRCPGEPEDLFSHTEKIMQGWGLEKIDLKRTNI
jgi:hypothetical protein